MKQRVESLRASKLRIQTPHATHNVSDAEPSLTSGPANRDVSRSSIGRALHDHKHARARQSREAARGVRHCTNTKRGTAHASAGAITHASAGRCHRTRESRQSWPQPGAASRRPPP